MRNCNEKLEKLLSTNNENALSTQQRATSNQKLCNINEICSFWKHAVGLYKALALSSICNCQATHGADLLLQHRTGSGIEFHIDFIKSKHTEWEVFKTRITDQNEEVAKELQKAFKLLESPSLREPQHRQLFPMRSAMKSSSSSTVPQQMGYVPSKL